MPPISMSEVAMLLMQKEEYDCVYENNWGFGDTWKMLWNTNSLVTKAILLLFY